jgi:uncharacterized coiled-coil protein SlyX
MSDQPHADVDLLTAVLNLAHPTDDRHAHRIRVLCERLSVYMESREHQWTDELSSMGQDMLTLMRTITIQNDHIQAQEQLIARQNEQLHALNRTVADQGERIQGLSATVVELVDRIQRLEHAIPALASPETKASNGSPFTKIDAPGA